MSILNSPDFNESSVGIWNQFFKEPNDKEELLTKIENRLTSFMKMAFRSPVDKATINRYSNYTIRKIEGGLSFTEGMKKTTSAILSSPRFFFRYGHNGENIDPYVLASNLSFFLWGSSPDEKLSLIHI